ncbi:MAG: GNAT family N-acetyltransferase [Polyangiaceae bacterium]
MRIRPITVGDVAVVAPLKAAVHALHVAAEPAVFKPMTLEAIAGWLRDRVTEPETFGLIAEDHEGPRGYLVGARREQGETSFSHRRAWLEIDEIEVEPRWRRTGVAAALLAEAGATARAWGLGELQLTTWAFNEPALAAFAKAGFAPMIGRYRRAP